MPTTLFCLVRVLLSYKIGLIVEYGLNIHLPKKYVAFRNRGVVKTDEKWFINDNPNETYDKIVYICIL